MTDFANEVERVYRQAVRELPYSSISVTGICKKAGITRKLFYRRFSGKDGILRMIFARDVVDPQAELCRLLSFDKLVAYAPSMERHMFAAVNDQADFYRCVLQCPQGGAEAFQNAAAAEFCAFNHMILAMLAYAGTELEKDYVASFFAQGKALFMARWIQEDCAMDAEEASALYARIALPFWNEACMHGKTA